MMRRAFLAFVVSAGLGAAIWAISPWVTGRTEPWDSEGVFYLASLIVGGFVSGLVIPKPLWGHYVGSVVGQLGFELLYLKLGALLLLGVVFMLGYSLIFLAGAIVGSYVRLHLGKGR